MSIRGKEVRPLIDAELHERLAIMAEFKDLQLALGARPVLARHERLEVLSERPMRLVHVPIHQPIFASQSNR